MTKDMRISNMELRIAEVMNGVRHSDLLKNIAIGDFYYRKFCKEKQDITFLELAKIPIGKSLPLPSVKGGSILTTNITKNSHGRTLYFDVKWTEGSVLVLHQHSDAEEEMTIEEGCFRLILKTKNGRKEIITLHVGDRINIASGSYHQLTALKKGTMKIKFTKTQ